MKNRVFLALLLAFTLPGGTGFAQQPPTTEQLATMLNTKGNLFFMRSNGQDAIWDSAKICYQRAAVLAPDDAGIVLNLALCYLVKEDTLKSDSLFQAAYAMSGSDSVQIYHLLGMFVQDAAPQRGAAKDSIKVKEHRIKGELTYNFAMAGDTRDQKKDKKADTDKTKQKPPRRPKKIAGERAADPSLYQIYLYWKN